MAKAGKIVRANHNWCSVERIAIAPTPYPYRKLTELLFSGQKNKQASVYRRYLLIFLPIHIHIHIILWVFFQVHGAKLTWKVKGICPWAWKKTREDRKNADCNLSIRRRNQLTRGQGLPSFFSCFSVWGWWASLVVLFLWLCGEFGRLRRPTVGASRRYHFI